MSFVIMCGNSPQGLSNAAITVSLEGYTSSHRLGSTDGRYNALKSGNIMFRTCCSSSVLHTIIYMPIFIFTYVYGYHIFSCTSGILICQA